MVVHLSEPLREVIHGTILFLTCLRVVHSYLAFLQQVCHSCNNKSLDQSTHPSFDIIITDFGLKRWTGRDNLSDDSSTIIADSQSLITVLDMTDYSDTLVPCDDVENH